MTTGLGAGIFEDGGAGIDGVTIDAWNSSRFITPPQFNDPAPSGDPDAQTLTTSTLGEPGSWQIALPTSDLFYIRASYNGQYYWRPCKPVASGGGGAGSTAGYWAPQHLGLSVWTNDLITWAGYQGTTGTNDGYLYLQAFPLTTLVTINNLWVCFSYQNDGSFGALSNCYLGIYSSAGNLVANTNDCSAQFERTSGGPPVSGGLVSVPVASATALSPSSPYDYGWFAILIGESVSGTPSFATMFNWGNQPFGLSGFIPLVSTGFYGPYTSLPVSVTESQIETGTSGRGFWGGIS